MTPLMETQTFTWPQCFAALFVDSYDGYNTKELALRHRLLKIDGVGLLLIVMLLINLMKSLTPYLEKPSVGSLRPPLVLACSTLYAVVAAFVLYEHVLVCPFPTEDTPDAMGLTQRIGRWVYLTRHVVTMQAVHGVCSCLADWGVWPEMRVPTHATAVLVAGLGLFVFVQFFALVYPEPDFVHMCLEWHSRNIPMQFFHTWTHIPCGVMAIIDVLLIKDRRLLREATAPLVNLVLYIVVYCSLYILLVHLNYSGTGYWPYGFMKDFGPWGVRWFIFTCAQTAILNGFMMAVWAAMTFRPELW